MLETVEELKKQRPDLVEDFEKMSRDELLNQIYLEVIDAINMEREGIRIYNKQIGQRLSEFTLVDLPLMDDPTGNSLLKSNVRLKQEEKFKNHSFS